MGRRLKFAQSGPKHGKRDQIWGEGLNMKRAQYAKVIISTYKFFIEMHKGVLKTYKI